MIIKSLTKPENENHALKDDTGNWNHCSKAAWNFLSTKTLPLDCEIEMQQDATGEPFIVKAVPKKQTGFNPANKFQPKKSEEKVDWDKLAFGKCKHAFLLEAFKQGKNLEEIEPECEAWARASMRVKFPLE